MEYLFFLGQNSKLSLAELESLLPDFQYQLHGSTAYLSTEEKLDLDDLNCRLGGTVKIASFVSSLDPQNPLPQLIDFIKQTGHKNFSLNLLSGSYQDALKLAKQLKDHLAEEDYSSRYLRPRQPFLSPLIIKDQQVTELTLNLASHQLFHTTHLHNFQHWIERDRHRPFVTPKQGMLPPKLARIMVNLGLNRSEPSKITFLDPFCGTGTVLMEAALLGVNTWGSDISVDKVSGTRKNLNWLPQDHFCQQPTQKAKLFQYDATHLSEVINQPLDLIVTEPPLGPVSPADEDISQIAKGLQKLYLGALKDWQAFLRDRARLVIALPRFKTSQKTITTHDFIDSHPALSYNILDSSLIFTRPGAKIERQILILEFIKNQHGQDKTNR